MKKKLQPLYRVLMKQIDTDAETKTKYQRKKKQNKNKKEREDVRKKNKNKLQNRKNVISEKKEVRALAHV